MKKIIVLSVLASSLFANHTHSDWHLSAGFGQMYSLKATTTQAGNSFKLLNPALYDLSMVYKNGFGMSYIAGTSDGVQALGGPLSDIDYKTKGYFASYQKDVNSVMQTKFLLGMTNQRVGSEKTSEKIAYGASMRYHFDFSKDICAFFETGFLKQHNAQYGNDVLHTSGGYLKIGFARAL